MDHSYILPFIKSITNVFETMLQSHVSVGKPSLKASGSPCYDVSGIIGMSGDVVGTIILSFKTDAAESIVALFCGEKLESGSPDFADAVGELVNMVSGGAKAQFTDTKDVSISCPSVIVGKDHGVALPSDVPCVVIPCTTDCGEFVIEVAIREAGATAGAAANNASASA